MKSVTRFLATATLVVASAAAHSTVIMSTDSLTGYVSITGFLDSSPSTYTINYRDLAGTVKANNIAAGNYTVSVQGSGSFSGHAGPGGTLTGGLNNPFDIFSGFLAFGGLLIPTYEFNFNAGVLGQNDGPGFPGLSFSTSYNGEMSASLFAQVNAAMTALGLPAFVDPAGSGTLDITGTLFTDGATFNITENADWFGGLGFAGVLRAIDVASGGGNGIIDGDFRLANFSVNANAVPEPSTIAIFGAALFGLGLMRRRSRV
ncbi:PEP-CTERM sorting domain-containing protein [Rheinheimera sp. UJ63]|uniref:PEP-CTERM sorting domain-containing protein n=1 Tax=Rheinheimera sp. UJ63 TaxID=2910157 RepID=UPI001F2084D5|nr:PEP-CTERM sorting domain-containing protein [Rheinheimera sp. UJ63]MCF4008414.1 PEP-CTERM sorting domain-containing protein [Rheinheimera sp. UJ63]